MLVGYIHGVAVVLIIGQLGKLLGLSIDARDPLPQLREVLRELGDVSGATIAVGRVALAALFGLALADAEAPRGAARRRRRDRALVGARPRGARDRDRRRDPGGAAELRDAEPRARGRRRSCVPAALGIFLVSFADEILTARSFAGKHNQHVRASQELLAMGAANAAAGVTQGFSVGASGSRTAVNDDMGARTQIAGLDRGGHRRS